LSVKVLHRSAWRVIDRCRSIHLHGDGSIDLVIGDMGGIFQDLLTKDAQFCNNDIIVIVSN